jgi:hypothetical protein
MEYPEYIVDMFNDYLEAKKYQLNSKSELQSMLNNVEHEVELYDIANPSYDRDVGWYAQLVMQAEKKYKFKYEWMH